MDKNNAPLPEVISSGEIELVPGLTITVHVLNDGRRIIAAEDMDKAINYLAGNNTEGGK